MRGTGRLLVAYLAVFFVVAAIIGVIIWQMTRSMTMAAHGPAGAMSSLSGMILWTTLAIVFVTVGGIVVLFFVMRRVMGGDRKLLATGIPGTALVLAVRDTGVTINNVNAVIEATLQVSLPGRPPYEAKAEVTLGRMSWGALQPGMTVAVKVAPDDPSRIAIDLSRPVSAMPMGAMPMGAGMPMAAPGMVATPGGSFPLAGVAGPMRADRVREAADVIAEGERAEGTIQAVSHTGATAGQMVPTIEPEKANDPMVFVSMQVQPYKGAAFAAQGIYRVPQRKLSALAIGRKVPVSYIPGEPSSATIDWSRL
ncbi:MAG: hypothetical protein KIT16_13695 [Rhodospirillaceae bacterium]|nr:hypothetical protein [Rhodospirillaceae bacterium]